MISRSLFFARGEGDPLVAAFIPCGDYFPTPSEVVHLQFDGSVGGRRVAGSFDEEKIGPICAMRKLMLFKRDRCARGRNFRHRSWNFHFPRSYTRSPPVRQPNKLSLRQQLGGGIHGSVYLLQGNTVMGGTALKVFHAREFFERELRVYERLKAAQIREILGFAVPQLIGVDDELLALEMTVVERPYVLDFAGAYLDNDAPWFEDEKWECGRRTNAKNSALTGQRGPSGTRRFGGLWDSPAGCKSRQRGVC